MKKGGARINRKENDKKLDKKDITKLEDLIKNPDDIDPISFYQADLDFDEDLTQEDLDILKQTIQTKCAGAVLAPAYGVFLK